MRKFQRNIENFVCENCGAEVRGNGYTNHCPVCLWSKHVDINPGDRKALCKGMMEPVGIELKSGEIYIVQQCQLCNFRKRNKASSGDDKDEIRRLSSSVSG